MTTQLATAAGINVTAIAGAHNFSLSKSCGASQVFDHKDNNLVDRTVEAIRSYGSNEFVGIFDAIATPDTYVHDLAMIERLGGGHLACRHPPPSLLPTSPSEVIVIKTGISSEIAGESSYGGDTA